MDIKITEKNEIIILHLLEDLSIDTVNDAKNIWKKQLKKNPEIIALDLKYVKHIDSTGIKNMINFHEESVDNSIELILYDLNDETQIFFKNSQLNGFFNIMSKDKFENELLV